MSFHFDEVVVIRLKDIEAFDLVLTCFDLSSHPFDLRLIFRFEQVRGSIDLAA